MAEQPDWQPISVLDDYTVARVFEVFGSQKDDLWLFEEQLARWKMDKLSVGQRHEVDRLTEQLGRCRTVIDSILSLAEQLGVNPTLVSPAAK
jgi:hypothetical protein